MNVLRAFDGSERSEIALELAITQFRTDRTVIHVLHADEWDGALASWQRRGKRFPARDVFRADRSWSGVLKVALHPAVPDGWHRRS